MTAKAQTLIKQQLFPDLRPQASPSGYFGGGASNWSYTPYPNRNSNTNGKIMIANNRWEDWHEDKTSVRHLLYLNARSYKTPRLFDIPPSPRGFPKYVLSPQGHWAYQNAILPAGKSLELVEGRVVWNGDIVLPMLVDTNIRHCDGEPFPKGTSRKKRVSDGAVWMSLTPMEMLTQRSGLQKARGKVVLGGLGLGWFLRKVCAKEDVTEVILVERSQELLDWYGYRICRKLPKVKDIICNDVYSQLGHHGDCQYLLDIWLYYDEARHDERLRTFRETLGNRVWAWGMD